MGLINFAKGEGSQAIQLFGRGVCLRGYEGCLKRSNKVDKRVSAPKTLKWLETLTIFSIRAQYIRYTNINSFDTQAKAIEDFLKKVITYFSDFFMRLP